ncbi:MAG: hypothetical protein HRU46_18390, partial [Verrucomicrobiales bacterium]|nr:hypothetical protein [Verrucomicrobiales bacterium]
MEPEASTPEDPLLNVLLASPEDWSVRLLVAERFKGGGFAEKAAALVAEAPVPPGTAEQLQQSVELAGFQALEQVRAFVSQNPADGYGHYLLGYLLNESGDLETARRHLEVAATLGYAVEAPAAADVPTEGGAEEGVDSPQPAEASEAQVVSSPESSEQKPVAEKPARKLGSKLTAIVIAIGVHVLFGVIAALLVVMPAKREETEVVATFAEVPAKKQEMAKKTVARKTRTTSAARAAAAPMAQLMRANAV